MREPIVDSINSALAAVLQTVQTPGDFFAAGECALHLPLIEVEGIGPIALPLLPAQAAQLIAAAERAPYGRGADTLVDTAVRRTWQIGADRVRIQGRHWPAMLDGIVERAAIGLGAGIGVEAELYRLLVYDEGGFFLEHRDTEKSPGMFGSLIVALPSLHTGGELVIRHRGREARLELRCADVSELAWAAFYADCVHEVLPITSGCRLVLVYNLRWGACCADGAKSRREPTRTGRSSWSTRWRTPTRRPSCRLRHSSADAAAATVLTTAAGGAGCDLHLALLRIEESGAAEYNDSAGPRWRSRYHDDDDDSDDQSDDEFRVAEVFDRSLTLSDWNRPDGGVAPLGTLPFSAGEICPPDSLGDMEAIDASNRLLPTGRIDTAGPRLYIRLDADLADPQALAALPIRAGDKVLRLADIATIRRGLEEPPSYLARARGQDAVLVGVVMNRGDNGQALGQRLDAWLQAERAALPLGMELTQLTNQADAIRKAVDLFQIKFLVAVAVVMGVSMLAIGLRAGLIVGIAVPVTLGVSFVVMLLMGINLDRITLGALIISLGLLVDDAIIAVEMMLMKIEEGWDKVRAAAHAWNVTAAPMLFGTLVTVAGFLPIGFARSGVGEYAGNIFWVLAVSLVVSWLVAVVFVPYLGVKMLRQVSVGEKHSHQAIYDTPLYRRLRALVAWCVRQRKTVVFGTVALLVLAGVGMATVVQKQFFPSSDRPEVLVGVYLPQGTAVAVTDATVRRLEAIMAPMPEVKTLSAYVGAGAPRFFISANPEPPNPAFGKLIAVAQDETARDKIIAVLEQHIRDGEFPEARVRVQRLLYGPPVIWPVQFRVFGPDPNGVRELAYRVREVMAANPHVVDAHLEWDERVPVLHLRTDADRLRLMGFTPQDVAQQLQLQLDGAPVTQLRRDTRTVDLVARGGFLGRRPDPQALAGLELLSREGRKVPAAQLGTLEVRYEEPVIKRYNREPFVAVQGEIRGAQPNDVTAAVWQALESVRNELPAGYRVAIGGSVEQSAKGEASIAKLQPVMVVAMLLFIMLQMRSFSGTFMVVATAPLGLIGAVLALLVFNKPFGFVALLGLTGLAGILMRNTLILTQQVSDNFEAGMGPFDGVVEAAVQRARPVVLTALAAVLAFVPLTQDSFWGPLAYVLIGGVAVGTLITLLFVPALYALWFRIQPAATA